VTASFETIRVERDGDVLVCTIDHPSSDLNAVDAALHRDLADLFTALRNEADARAILLTGSGRAFCAGGDFNWFPQLQEPGALEHLRMDARRMIIDLLDVPLPIVCAVNGPAVGLGASVALMCDVIYIARGARIGDPHVKVGVVAGDGGAVIWPLLIGPARAKEFLLTGDLVDADEAERIGLVNHVSEPGSLMDDAMAMARKLASGAPLAIRYTKLAVNKLVKDALNANFDAATALELFTFKTEDHAEALAAIREKRDPHFQGS
jgi:enoyl-CoA hydratase